MGSDGVLARLMPAIMEQWRNMKPADENVKF